MINKDSFDTSTTVSIQYSKLPRDSLHRLEQILRDWVTWQKKSYPAVVSEHQSDVCSGTLQYCPELAGHAGGRITGLAYVDKPSKPHYLPSDCSFNVQYERVGGVPKYDHVTEMSLDGSLEAAQPAGRSAQKSAGTTPWRQSRRCFNCGSFSHSLKDCPETRDAGAIAQARRESQQGRVSLGNERYFTAAPEELADLQPGMLSAELRAALGGLGSADPPPWLHRMRDLGYPPGYMSAQRPSWAPEPGPGEHDGLVLLDDTAELRGNVWDNEHDDVGLDSYSGQIKDTVDPAQRQRVAIPGVNAPVPTDADLEKWSYRPSELCAKSGQTSPRKRRRMHPPGHSSSAPPQYAPQCVPDGQAWTPQPPPSLYTASSGPWMQQGYVTPPPAYPGGQPGSIRFYAPSLQPGSMPNPYSQSSTLGHPEYPAATPTLPTIQQHGQTPHIFGRSYYHGGTHVHPVYDQAATAYLQAGAFGFPSSADTGMLQESYMNGYSNGRVSPGPFSMLGGVSAAGMLEQEVPPLPPESEEDTPPPLPPLDSGS